MSRLQCRLTLAGLAGLAASAAAGPPMFASVARSFTNGDPTSVSRAYRSHGLASADLDMDGDEDMVFAHAGNVAAPQASILFNRGDGSYAPPVYLRTLAGETYDVVAADLSGDGVPDLAFVQTDQGAISGSRVIVFINNGDGTFQAERTFTVGTGPADIVAADFDVDGDVDLAIANHGQASSNVSVLWNGGNGTAFTRADLATTLPSSAPPCRLAVGDLSNDGVPDLLVAFEASNRWGWYPSFGGGQLFGAIQLQMTTGFQPAANTRVGLAVIDWDGDGDDDVIYGGSRLAPDVSGYGVTPFINSFGFMSELEPVYGPRLFWTAPDLVARDLNADGVPDIACAGGDVRGIQVMLSSPLGYVAHDVRTADQPRGVIVLDADGDGRPDLATSDFAALTAHVFTNSAEGFRFPEFMHVDNTGGRFAVADLDGDGDLDIVNAAIQLHTFLNLGDGTYFHDVRSNLALARMEDIGLADISGDGFPDLCMMQAANSPFLGYNFHYLINDGTGAFGDVNTVFLGSCGATNFEFADADDDGDTDVLIVETNPCGTQNFGYLYILRNTGGPELAPLFDDPSASSIYRNLRVADLTGDGRDDIAYIVNQSIRFRPGQGPLGFGLEVTVPTPGGMPPPLTFELGDMTGDGLADIVATSYYGENTRPTVTWVMRNLGAGTFESAGSRQHSYQFAYPNVKETSLFDYDNDGDLDVANICFYSADVVMLVNSGSGTLVAEDRYAVPGDINSIGAHDMDGDGDLELIANVWDRVPFPGAANAIVVLDGLASSGCPADLTGASDPLDPRYGAPDGAIDASDFFYFLDQFAAGNLAVADVTGASDPQDPRYGAPDGVVDAADFFYFLDIFVQGCV